MTAAKTIVATVEADAATANMPAVKERLNMLKETISDAETRGVISKDEDARTGHKTAHSSFFGYKTHIAMRELSPQLPSPPARRVMDSNCLN